MYIDICKYKRGNKQYKRTLLRRGYRDPVDGRVRHETIANLSQFSDQEIESLKIALNMKGDLAQLKRLAEGEFTNGKMVGAVAALYQVASRLDIPKSLGVSRDARRVLWLAFARLIDQGSRLSAVRLAENHAVCEILGMEPFDESDLYSAMDWLASNQAKVEKKLFDALQSKKARAKAGTKTPGLFLYDVSSSYFEGQKNELAAYGYNRNGKKGKMQVVYGLLTDEDGEPIAIEPFAGNTKDNGTLQNQVNRLKERFGCESITLVGDKGMIKSAQIEDLERVGFHYITGITKPQIRELLRIGTLQMELFDETLCEVEDIKDSGGRVRYVLRRNPHRAEQTEKTRLSKIESIREKTRKANIYLSEHPRSKVETQLKHLNEYVKKLKLDRWISLETSETKKELSLQIDNDGLREACKLDGCYVIKTDLPCESADKELVHRRYKALSLVEWAFRTKKTGYLEVRPIYVRKKERTYAHLFIVMLAYKIERHLREAWRDLNLTVEEGIRTLAGITSMVITIGEDKIVRVPQPNQHCQDLLERIDVTLPNALPYMDQNVATRKKLNKQRNKRVVLPLKKTE